MDFRAELEHLLRQIPAGRIARLSEVAGALGDPRAAVAIARMLRGEPPVPGAHRVVTESGRPVRASGVRDLRAEGWDPAKLSGYFRAFESAKPLASLRREQMRLAARVSERTGFRAIRTVAGVDVAYEGDRGFAALVVLRWKDLAVIEEVLVARVVDFPYVPTYLAYREFPLIEAAARRLSHPPTVLLVDGHGRLHPARCGIACLVGLKLRIPTIGVAKSPLVGTPDRRPNVGESVLIRHEGEILGLAVRASSSVKPLYVSTGDRVSMQTAVRIVRRLCVHRNPEPLRLADALAQKWKRSQKGSKRIHDRSHPESGRPEAKTRND